MVVVGMSLLAEKDLTCTNPSRELALSEQKKSLHNSYQPGEMGALYRAKAGYEKHPRDTLC